MIPTDISRALAVQTEAVAVTLGLTGLVDFPDTGFKIPDKPVRYLEVRHFPNEPVNPLWDESAIYTGIYQIGLVSYVQQGEVPEREICGIIAAAFKRNTLLTHGSTTVRIERTPTILSVLQDGQKATYPVSIRYRTSGLT